ncbi:rhomboid family intramembrane serine protease [Leptobacterium flavescens]|uniref:Rhomboid family intramembrane serine protease n=1 Tax=Leptobacterium flavescens TaxID=472055 RepID=A0A6P0URH5_9FLAO|nr:rhomboid family intramembrane serine protease [Leptobacterium flavescens]NER15152.1 rhomboid family intramembrane serine protease [Leptobacterium flavescens]
MSRKEAFKFDSGVVLYPFLFGLTIWLVYWFELRFGFDFTSFGVYPRTLSGLKGVVFSPFIHSSIEHLYNNTFPLLILSMALFYFYSNVSWKVILYGMLSSGILTWIIGREAYHIGASGIIYMLSSFIFFRGIFAGYYRLVAVSLIVVFLYGSLVWYVFPVDSSISWEGHLAGFLTGFVFSFFFKEKLPVKRKYQWETEGFKEEQDPFLKHFDEDGNFVPTSELERRMREEEEDQTP